MKYTFIDYLKEESTFYADWIWPFQTPRWRGFLYIQIIPVLFTYLYLIHGFRWIAITRLDSLYSMVILLYYLLEMYKFISGYYKRKKEVLRKPKRKS